MIKELFYEVFGNYVADVNLVDQHWQELANHYEEKMRKYHNLQHLEDILIQLQEVKDKIKNWEAILFSLFYHDIIYKPLRNDNEEKSAVLARKIMGEINVSEEMILLCVEQILATKTHQTSVNSDTNYFTDADLSILGRPWEEYLDYSKKIRAEYKIYPDMIYNAGRKKVLKHFLAMENIFKTNNFRHKFQDQALTNLKSELSLLE